MLTDLCTLNFCAILVLLQIRRIGQMHSLCLCPNAGMRYMHETGQIELLLHAHMLHCMWVCVQHHSRVTQTSA